jgi:hypothetical protein
MNSWAKYNSTVPQQTYIPNRLGMAVTIQNDTDDNVYMVFPDLEAIHIFEPRETKYYYRDINDVYDFLISPGVQVYNIPRYVNNVVIRKIGTNMYQPAFFFSTRKFVG